VSRSSPIDVRVGDYLYEGVSVTPNTRHRRTAGMSEQAGADLDRALKILEGTPWESTLAVGTYRSAGSKALGFYLNGTPIGAQDRNTQIAAAPARGPVALLIREDEVGISSSFSLRKLVKAALQAQDVDNVVSLDPHEVNTGSVTHNAYVTSHEASHHIVDQEFSWFPEYKEQFQSQRDAAILENAQRICAQDPVWAAKQLRMAFRLTPNPAKPGKPVERNIPPPTEQAIITAAATSSNPLWALMNEVLDPDHRQPTVNSPTPDDDRYQLAAVAVGGSLRGVNHYEASNDGEMDADFLGRGALLPPDNPIGKVARQQLQTVRSHPEYAERMALGLVAYWSAAKTEYAEAVMTNVLPIGITPSDLTTADIVTIAVHGTNAIPLAREQAANSKLGRLALSENNSSNSGTKKQLNASLRLLQGQFGQSESQRIAGIRTATRALRRSDSKQIPPCPAGATEPVAVSEQVVRKTLEIQHQNHNSFGQKYGPSLGIGLRQQVVLAVAAHNPTKSLTPDAQRIIRHIIGANQEHDCTRKDLLDACTRVQLAQGASGGLASSVAVLEQQMLRQASTEYRAGLDTGTQQNLGGIAG
jgi:hypothetical protein